MLDAQICLEAVRESPVVGSIVHGLVIGVGAGLVSSIILGVFHYARRRWVRRDQVRYLKRCITDGFAKMQSNVDLHDPGGEAPSVKAEDLRPMYFEEFWRNLAAAVDHRTTALSDNQVFDLHKAMTSTTEFVRFVRYGVERAARAKGQEPPSASGTGLPTDIRFYRNVYGMFLEIEWLGLPKDMLRQSS